MEDYIYYTIIIILIIIITGLLIWMFTKPKDEKHEKEHKESSENILKDKISSMSAQSANIPTNIPMNMSTTNIVSSGQKGGIQTKSSSQSNEMNIP